MVASMAAERQSDDIKRKQIDGVVEQRAPGGTQAEDKSGVHVDVPG